MDVLDQVCEIVSKIVDEYEAGAEYVNVGAKHLCPKVTYVNQNTLSLAEKNLGWGVHDESDIVMADGDVKVYCHHFDCGRRITVNGTEYILASIVIDNTADPSYDIMDHMEFLTKYCEEFNLAVELHKQSYIDLLMKYGKELHTACNVADIRSSVINTIAEEMDGSCLKFVGGRNGRIILHGKVWWSCCVALVDNYIIDPKSSETPIPVEEYFDSLFRENPSITTDMTVTYLSIAGYRVMYRILGDCMSGLGTYEGMTAETWNKIREGLQ